MLKPQTYPVPPPERNACPKGIVVRPQTKTFWKERNNSGQTALRGLGVLHQADAEREGLLFQEELEETEDSEATKGEHRSESGTPRHVVPRLLADVQRELPGLRK